MNIETAHAHIVTNSVCCDGPTGSEYSVYVSDEAKAKSAATGGVNDFWEIEFRQNVMASAASVYVEHSAEMKISPRGFEYVETTDEGYRHVDVEWCDDAGCNPEQSSSYDAYAEAMGY